jgi:hypothetical protein
LETAVQLIEGIFYIWLITQFSYISNVTPKRYLDWFITTPTMLFTLCIYLDYLHHKESFEQMDLYGLFQTHKQTFIPIAILNSMMLLFGYLGETKLLNKYLAVLLGFIPFVLFFGMIYDKYAKYAKVIHILCTARPFGRKPLYCCSGHVRTRSSNNINSGLLWQCKTTSSA